MNKFYKTVITLLCVTFISSTLYAQNSFFTDAGANKMINTTGKRTIIPEKFRTVEANTNQLRTFLWSLPSEKTVDQKNAPILELPMPDGSMAKFRVWESSIQEPGLEAKFPEIRTFAGQGIDDPYATIRFDYTPFGFHAQVLSIHGNIYIDPYARGDINNYMSYYNRDNKRDSHFVCEVAENLSGLTNKPANVLAGPCRGTQLYTYRLALANTGEYAVAVGGTTAALLHAAIVTTVNRVDGVYENEVSIRLVLIANNNVLEFLSAATDPFNGNNNAGTLINESQTVITNAIGNPNFDIGHTFSTGGGGLAGLGVVCINGQKASGITGSPAPFGDGYDIDYVAHEMGHQFGGNHTFNSTTSNCGGGNRNASTAYEVGSGTTIQAYAGICGSDDIQLHSDAVFHTVSFDEISNYVEAGGASCKVATATGNNIPVITSMNNNGANIPLNTPFTLTGTATDADGDAITYCWEEWDLGTGGAWNNGANSTTAPLFKSRIPIPSGSRTFPDIAVILAGYPANPPAPNLGGLKGETLPLVARAIKFRLTVRDNHAGGGGVATGGNGCQLTPTFQINTIAGTGPFIVTVPNGGESYAGNSTQTVTWNVAGTFAAPISATDVKISLSTDGGFTYPTVLVASTANDGSESVTIPNTPSTTARVKVEAVGNVFFDISNANFTITAATSGFTFNATTPTVVACPAPATPTVTLGTTANGSFSTPINLTAIAGVPAGTTVSFSPNPVTPGNSTTVTLNNANTLPNGTYAITVQGVAGTVTQTAVVTFTVSAGTGPVITGQPANVTVCAGAPASFTVTATGVTTYQWQVNTGTGFNNIVGANAASFNIAATTGAQNGFIYQCVLTGQCGTTTSASATLTVNTPPAITTQPASTVVCVGTNATFTVTATGAGLGYQWELSVDGCNGPWFTIPGANTNTYVEPGITLANDNSGYRCIVTGSCAPTSVTSNCALLTVGNAAAITVQPVDVTVCEGQNAVFSVTGTGSISSYQWQEDAGAGFANIAGATSATLTLNAVTVAMSGHQYRVNVFSCTAIPIVSAAATLTVNSLATIGTQPISTSGCIGDNVSFTAAASGTGTGYQWQYAATCAGTFANIAGATSATLNLNSITLANAGAYRVVVAGTCNTATSSCVTLTVNSPITISAQPVDMDVCLPTTTASFSVTAAGTNITYQWQVNTGTGFADIGGETNATLNLTGLTAAMSGYQYRVVLNGTCTADLNSAAATLQVNSPAVVTVQPSDVATCTASAAVFTATATGSTIGYQWQMSSNGGISFVNVPSTAPFTGGTTNTLTISPVNTTYNGYVFHLNVSGAPCASDVSEDVTLTVNTLPVVVLTAASYSNINPYLRETLYATVSPSLPAGQGYKYEWYRDGVLQTNITGDRFDVTVDDLGSYEVVVTDTATGCISNNSNAARVDAAPSSTLFIFPNPSSGQFEVRFYNASSTTSRTLNIYDSKGARVYTKAYPITSPYTQMYVDMTNVAGGVYLVELRDAAGKRMAVGKVVIKQ